MDGRRTALIVASDEFEHAGLSRLQAPMADAEALAGVLGDPEIGGFQVEVVHNAPSHAVQAHVEDLFAEGRPDDLLLLHFSGHGLKSDSGELFFASTNTRPDRLASTAVSADFVQRCMRGSRARSIVLFLDCCYGGAFGEGVAVRAAGPANVLDSFPAGKLGGGRGRAVITASSAMEYAFEGSSLATDDQLQPSVFTSAVVEGLRSGAADRDEDGLVSLNELYDYVFDQVRAQNPNQTPSRDIELQGELYVARSQRKRVRAVPLPPDLRAAVHDDNMYTRLGAVGELRARLASTDPGVALGARETLQDIARADTSYVADAARDALAASEPVGAVSHGPLPTEGVASTIEGKAVQGRAVQAKAAQARTTPAKPKAASARSAAAKPPTPTTQTEPGETLELPESPESPEPAGPAGSEHPEEPPVLRHRVNAGRTLLTGGCLLLVSAILPDFVWSERVYTFHPELAVVLISVGVLSAGVAAATLFVTPFRVRWLWPVRAAAVAALVTAGLILYASAEPGLSGLDLGIWVALAGSLTTLAAGVVALAGLRAVPDSSASSHAGPRPAPTRQSRTVGYGALVASTTVLVASFAVPFTDNTRAMEETDLVWAWLFPGVVGLTAGILTLWLSRWPQVGPALLAGAGAAAVWALWDLPRTLVDPVRDPLNSGFFLEFAGLIGLIAVGWGSIAVLRREHALVATRPATTGAALVASVGLLTAVPFVRVAEANLSSSERGDAAHDLAMAILVVLVPVLTAMLRPGELGRLVLIGWSVGATGTVVAYWRLLRRGGYPLYGIPYALLAMAAFVVIALVMRPSVSISPAPDRTTRPIRN